MTRIDALVCEGSLHSVRLVLGSAVLASPLSAAVP